MRTRILVGLLALLLSSGTAAAQNCNANPFTLTNGQPADASQVMANFNNALACAAQLQVRMPGGRLTLATGAAVMTSDVAGATTVFYTPYLGRLVPIWNGTTAFVMTDTGGELSQATTDTTKSPSAVAAGSVYDIFVWNDGGTIRATRGPAWASLASRGTGLGTTQLQLLNGIYVNANAIANGPSANLGTYVGTISSNGSAQIDWKLGSSASGGGTATLGVWNAYNRVAVRAQVSDSTASWTYGAATVRPANNSTGNRVNLVSGLPLEAIDARYYDQAVLGGGSGPYALFGLVLDSTTTMDRYMVSQATVLLVGIAAASYVPQLGLHFIQAVEYADGNTTTTFLGGPSTLVGGPALRQALEVRTVQ
jgi:hypothetical protein